MTKHILVGASSSWPPCSAASTVGPRRPRLQDRARLSCWRYKNPIAAAVGRPGRDLAG